MPTPTTISPIEQFRELFPLINVVALEDELRYKFKGYDSWNFYFKRAQKMILKHKLRVTAEKEQWASGGYVHELAIVVKPVPEEDLI
ncbi:MAG TPA: hypothetical protein VL832_28120 [Puia sp.]|jgi:hypothetical protein|nr:hypothetical protein [Puia sp.]